MDPKDQRQIRVLKAKLALLDKLNFSQVEQKEKLIVEIGNVFYNFYFENGKIIQTEESNRFLLQIYQSLDSMLGLDLLSQIIVLYVDNHDLTFAYDDICCMIHDKMSV